MSRRGSGAAPPALRRGSAGNIRRSAAAAPSVNRAQTSVPDNKNEDGSIALRVVLYVILVALVAAIAYVIYRVVTQKSEEDDGEKKGLKSSRYTDEDEGDEYDDDSSEEAMDNDKEPLLRHTSHYVYSYKEGFDGQSPKYRLVYLHMDGCMYCRRFDPVWKEFTRVKEEELSKLGVHPVDYESQSAEANQYDASGFPTVLLAKDDGKTTVATFEGDRTVPSLMRFVKENVDK